MDLRRRILAKANNLFFISLVHDLNVVATKIILAKANNRFFISLIHALKGVAT
jgi:hypothetical protein